MRERGGDVIKPIREWGVATIFKLQALRKEIICRVSKYGIAVKKNLMITILEQPRINITKNTNEIRQIPMADKGLN